MKLCGKLLQSSNIYTLLLFFSFFATSKCASQYISLANHFMIVYNIFFCFNSLAEGVKTLILKSIVIDKAIFTLMSYIS